MSNVELPLTAATRVGEEVCWRATEVLAALDAFALANSVVLGVELWRLADDGLPEVIGWSDYRVDLAGAWPVTVRAGHRLATDAVIGFASDEELWVNVAWLPPNPSTVQGS